MTADIFFNDMRLTPFTIPGAALCAFFCALSLSCIKRNNPFDPINYHPSAGRLDSTAIAAIRDSIFISIDSSLAAAAAHTRLLDSILAARSAAASRNAAVDSANALIRASNDAKSRHNDSIAAYNDTVSRYDSLSLKVYLALLDSLVRAQAPFDAGAVRDAVIINKLRADSIMNGANFRYAPDTIFTAAMRNSVFSIFDSLASACDSAAALFAAFNTAVADTNASIAQYNRAIAAVNDAIARYNDSIQFIRRFAPYPVLAASDSISDRLFTAAAGDTFVIPAGTFEPLIRLSGSGTADHPIVIAGQPDMSSVFAKPDVVLSANSHIVFYNIAFTLSRKSAVKIEAGCRGIVFENCRFDSSAAHGLEIIDSDAELRNCRLTHNNSHGLRVSSGAGNTVRLNNTLIAHNRLMGIDVVEVNLFLQNVTIAHNGTDGIFLADPERLLSIAFSIISYNGGYGVRFASGFNGNYPFTLMTTVVYGNTTADMYGTFEPAMSYLTHAPVFIDESADNYAVAPGNRLHELEQEGVVIGYRP